MAYEYLDDGEFIDTGYGFMSNNGVEVCSDSELDDCYCEGVNVL